MIRALANAWRVPELRRKLLFTAVMLILYRLGSFIPLPGVSREALAQAAGNSTSNAATGLLNTFTGGALSQLSVFSLGIMPYITASIVMQLMTVAVPRLQELSKDGETGQAKITQYTRYFTLGLSLLQSVALMFFIRSGGIVPGALSGATPLDYFMVVLTLTAGTMLVMWIGEIITQRGLGNGISLVIASAILSQAPGAVRGLVAQGNIVVLVVLGILAVIIIAAIVFVNEGARRIPVTYAKRQVGRRTTEGATTYLPLKVNMAGVIPIIFASSLLIFPTVLTQVVGTQGDSVLGRIALYFSPPAVPYLILFAILIVLFTYFYTAVQFNPIEHADNLKKSGGYVPGIRPGRPTAEYLNDVLTRITLAGALFLAAISILPYIVANVLNLPGQVYLAGTSMLIVVGVSLDTVRQLESQLMMRNYEGFLKKKQK